MGAPVRPNMLNMPKSAAEYTGKYKQTEQRMTLEPNESQHFLGDSSRHLPISPIRRPSNHRYQSYYVLCILVINVIY